MLRRRIAVIMGTRPEAIKLGPVVHALKARDQEFETVDLLKDYENLLKIYRSEYSRSILLEVERQSLIFCQEFEKYYRACKNEISRKNIILKFINKLSRSMLIVDASTTETLTSEDSDTEEIETDYIRQVNKVIVEMEGESIIYFEDVESEEDPPRINMNGISVKISNQVQLLVFGIPYDNLLYLIYAANWMSQLYADMNETI